MMIIYSGRLYMIDRLKDQIKSKKWIFNIIPVIFFVFTFFGFGIGELYITNRSEFWFPFKDIFPTILVTAIVLFLVLSLIVLLVPEKVRLWVQLVMYGVTIAVYIQGNFLPNDYGSLNGEVIDWSAYSSRAFVNTRALSMRSYLSSAMLTRMLMSWMSTSPSPLRSPMEGKILLRARVAVSEVMYPGAVA